MKVLTMLITGASDATRAGVGLHLAANGTVEVGDESIVLLAGDGTEYLAGDAIERSEGVGVPPMRDLIAKLRDRKATFYV